MVKCGDSSEETLSKIVPDNIGRSASSHIGRKCYQQGPEDAARIEVQRPLCQCRTAWVIAAWVVLNGGCKVLQDYGLQVTHSRTCGPAEAHQQSDGCFDPTVKLASCCVCFVRSVVGDRVAYELTLLDSCSTVSTVHKWRKWRGTHRCNCNRQCA